MGRSVFFTRQVSPACMSRKTIAKSFECGTSAFVVQGAMPASLCHDIEATRAPSSAWCGYL